MSNPALTFIQDMAIIMLMAGLTTILCHRLKQPIVLGYIIAGIIIGPHTPPFSFISDETTIRTLAELGIIFLMFSLGLEFNLPKLSKVGIVACIAAVLEIILMIGLGYGIGCLFGWTQIDSIFLGALLSISSTTIIVKTLKELGFKKEPFVQLIFGILIVEDIFAILILALLSSIAITGSIQIKETIVATAKLSSFLVLSLLIGILLIPRLIAYVAKFKSKEMLLISVLGLCFGFSLLVVKLHYSVALGAFIIGAIIAESRELAKIEHLINPIRDMFSALFFVSVGLLFDLDAIGAYYIPIIVITLAVIIGKVLSCSLGVMIAGRDGKTSMRVGMGLAQIGEFSFIIASLGITLKVTGEFLYSIAVGVSIITTLFTPYLIKYSDSFTQLVARFIPKKIAHIFGMYTTWIQHFQSDESHSGSTRHNIMQIESNDIHIWTANLDEAWLEKEDSIALLSKDECERAHRFHFPIHRQRFIAGRSLLRKIISLYTQVPPKEITFSYEENNKPSLQFPFLSSLKFNLSHSEQMAVFAFTLNHPIGVDIEKIQPDYHARVVERFFSPEENQALSQLPVSEQPAMFYRIWACKEAMIKAIGKGLFLPLSSFTISANDAFEKVIIDNISWSLFPLSIDPAFQSAVATNQKVKKVIYWKFIDQLPELVRVDTVTRL